MNELDAKALEQAADDKQRKQEQLLQNQMQEAEKIGTSKRVRYRFTPSRKAMGKALPLSQMEPKKLVAK